jgi:hypothetical protein
MSEFFHVFENLVREFLASATDAEVDGIARLVRDEYRRRGTMPGDCAGIGPEGA